MPGHMYHQNQMKDNEPRPDNSTAGNKSSLESSGPITTDSSKGSNHSLTKDLEKCVDLLKVTLQKRYDDGNTKKKLIKDIVHRLINSKYRDDETTTEFLSGLTFDTKKLGNKENNTTTSTSDANNTEDSANKKPKKSILRNEKFNPNVVASTSQSAPNLFSASSEKLNTNLMKALASNTDSDVSSRGKTSSENAFPKTSSEELYLKYLEALRREEAYKRHLKDKEMFLKQKLVSSEAAFKVPIRQEVKVSSRLKDLMNDLTRNNYDDGSGDASKLEGGSSSNMHFERFNAMRNQRSHSVFTLSSSHSECQKRPNLKKKMQAEREISEAGPSKHHYCCCPHHYLNSKVDCVDSSVQVNIKQCEEAAINDRTCQTKPPECKAKPCECKKCKPLSPRNTRVIPDKKGEIKYVCLCNGKQVSSSDVGDNFMIFKCSKLTNRGVQLEDPVRIGNTGIQCESICNSVKDDKIDRIQSSCQMNTGTESSNSDNTSKHARRYSKSSQTNMVVNMCQSGSEAKNLCGTTTKCILDPRNMEKCYTVCEATRCLQTEISINPQISDPSLSDINIIDDCVKLICENRRKIAIQSSDSEGGKSFSNVCTNSTSEKLLTQSAGSLYSEVKFKRSEEEKQASKEPTSLLGKDYTVPIKGTNMTITVNLTGTDINKKVDQVNEGVATEEICTADEATSAIEKNKSTQCLGTIFVDKSKFCMIEPSVSRKSCLSKKQLIESSTHCNTIPKIDAAKIKPPFKRSNTDTGKLSICSCIQTDFIKTKDVECNNNQTVIICDEPCTQVVTCENSSQVDKGCECKDTKTDSIKSNKSETCNKTIKINIGIQKDFCDEDAKIEAEKPKTKICCCTNDVGVATETEAKTDKGFCVGCQTDVITKDKNQEADCKPSCSDKEPKETPVKPDACCFQVCFPRKSNKDPVKPDCKPSCSDSEPKETPVQPNTCCCKVCFPEKSNKGPVKPDCKPSCSDSEPKETPIQPDTCCCKVCFPGKLSKGPVKLDCKSSCSNNEPKVTLVQPDTCCCKVCFPGKSSKSLVKPNYKASCSDNEPKETPVQPETCCYKVCFPGKSSKGPVIDMIQDITRRYSKTEMVKIKNNKCFSEIITVLNYLLETDESTEPEPKTCYSTCTDTKSSSNQNKSNKISDVECCSDKLIDKSIQLSCKKSFKDNKVCAESSDLPCSSDMPTTSSDSAACKVLNKIKKECEKYHQKVKCRGRKCEVSSSTSVNCEKCKKVHHCACRSHKCKRSKAFEKLQKKCIAYNLIIQTSESMLSEDTVCEKKNRPLKNIFLKVPKRKCDGKKESTCREQVSHRSTPRCSPKCTKDRSRSCPDECETSDENARRFEVATLREYLEQNRPDFVEKTSQRRNCLKFISERRANERATQRDLLSLHVEQQPDLTNLSSDELRLLAKQIGLDLRRKRPDPKFISEREMKRHSEKIYKTLPEVVQKKEEKKKENIKKTNLLMANLFKKNLQKQALRGSVNRSNYSMVIKI